MCPDFWLDYRRVQALNPGIQSLPSEVHSASRQEKAKTVSVINQFVKNAQSLYEEQWMKEEAEHPGLASQEIAAEMQWKEEL